MCNGHHPFGFVFGIQWNELHSVDSTLWNQVANEYGRTSPPELLYRETRIDRAQNLAVRSTHGNSLESELSFRPTIHIKLEHSNY